MSEARRPYAPSSIDDLEAIFGSHPEDSVVLSLLVEELSHRKTQRARHLLALVADRLANLEPEADDTVEPGGLDDDLLSTEEDPDTSERKNMGTSVGDDNVKAAAAKPPADSDQPPDDRKRPERLSLVRPVGTPGLPEPRAYSLKAGRPLGVPTDADLPQIYAAALAALIVEIKSTGAGQKRYELENGIRAAGNEPVYEFSFTDEADLFEDAKVEVEVSGRHIDASIISISSGRLWLATDEELGGIVRRVVLLVDATALLEALKQRIEDAYKGQIILNRVIADAVVGLKQPPPDPVSIPEVRTDNSLDFAKSKALRRALTASVTYVWGPPGCGKTLLLSEIVRSGFRERQANLGLFEY